jgi:hypothetical protein
MLYFEGKQVIYNILCFVIIPLTISSILIRYRKPKMLWLTPLVSLIIFLIVTVLFYPYILTDMVEKNYDFTTIYWVVLVLPIQIVASIIITVITFFITRSKKKNIR